MCSRTTYKQMRPRKFFIYQCLAYIYTWCISMHTKPNISNSPLCILQEHALSSEHFAATLVMTCIEATMAGTMPMRGREWFQEELRVIAACGDCGGRGRPLCLCAPTTPPNGCGIGTKEECDSWQQRQMQVSKCQSGNMHVFFRKH
jgi:hypothetical protein